MCVWERKNQVANTMTKAYLFQRGRRRRRVWGQQQQQQQRQLNRKSCDIRQYYYEQVRQSHLHTRFNTRVPRLRNSRLWRAISNHHVNQLQQNSRFVTCGKVFCQNWQEILSKRKFHTTRCVQSNSCLYVPLVNYFKLVQTSLKWKPFPHFVASFVVCSSFLLVGQVNKLNQSTWSFHIHFIHISLKLLITWPIYFENSENISESIEFSSLHFISDGIQIRRYVGQWWIFSISYSPLISCSFKLWKICFPCV